MRGDIMRRHLNNLISGNGVAMALALLVLSPVSVVYADEEGEASSSGHWYAGLSTAYLKPDDDRGAGNTSTLGMQGGYQLNDNWSVDAGYQTSAGRYNYGTWSARTEMYDLNVIRHWGDKYRFLVEFGYSHIMVDASGPDDATAAFHIGAGASAFVTDNLEIRAMIKDAHSQNEEYTDYVATLSLNWHFGGSHAAAEETSTTSDATEAQTIPPETAYQEPAPVAAAAEPAVEPAAAAAVVAAGAAASTSAEPKGVYTLQNFKSNSLDLSTESAKLDQISAEMKATNASAVVEGHTDNKGSAENNKVLSLDRAIVVKRELKNRGVSSDKIRAVGMGGEHPIASNDTPEGRAQNRRVEVKVYDK